jgi:hypothetical protein
MHVSIEQAVSAEELGLSKHPANHRQNAADLTLFQSRCSHLTSYTCMVSEVVSVS